LKKENTELQEKKENESFQVPVFGYELVREVLLDDILGKDSPQVLYWAGKRMARRFPLTGKNEIISFFQSAGWGNLEVLKESKDEMEFLLTGDVVARRLDVNEQCHFQLEAGFLAEQFSLQNKLQAEAIEETKSRAKKVIFTVKWDKKDSRL
jgi:predicted hydrocarbon binding protein